MIIAILATVLLAYVIFIILTIAGWNKNAISIQENDDLVSVVVPFRNEQNNLETTINSILANKGNFELILVNDHSEDNSLSIALDYESKYDHVTVLTLPKETGKKAAIKLGVENANGEIILQTDADCLVQKDWIITLNKAVSSNVKLLIGPVKIQTTLEKWNWFNQLEFGFLQAFTCASANYNYPIMANGANMMYLKSVYWEYENSKLGAEYASGDDQFLLNYVKSTHKNAIKYLKDSSAVVTTYCSSDWNHMLKQRARWAKKNTKSSGIDAVVSLFLLFAQFILPTTLVLCFFNVHLIAFFWSVLILKTAVEFILANQFMKFFHINRLKYIPLFALVYPFFILRTILLVNDYNHLWKGRRV
jgi:biofilm PGA synthesis N-glycosyltransferase PgaC